MIRNLMAKIRLLVLGPVLNRLSRLTPGQIESLIMMTNDGVSLFLDRPETNTSVTTALDQGIVDEVTRLRMKVADLTERLEVLERLYK